MLRLKVRSSDQGMVAEDAWGGERESGDCSGLRGDDR